MKPPSSPSGISLCEADVVDQIVPETDLVIRAVMGSCAYRARSVGLGRDFFVKVVPAQVDGARRWQRQVMLLGRLKSPHIARIARAVEQDSRVFLVTDWVEGSSLDGWVAAHGVFSAASAAKLLRQLALALHEVHENGVAHLSVAPDNVMLTTMPNGELFLRLVDFGSMEVWGARPRRLRQRRAGYVAPELTDETPIAGSVDLYALGATIYFALMGAHPARPSADHASALLRRHPTLGGRTLTRLTSQLMSVDPRERPDCLTVIHALTHELWGRRVG